MIRFYNVTKVAGRKRHARTVLDGVDWLIPAGARHVILSVQPTDGTILLDIISGSQLPTRGWVERRGIVSTAAGHLRSASPQATPRQLVCTLAKIYHIETSALMFFVEQLSDLGEAMMLPLRFLNRSMRQRLAAGLFYGIPSDFYLFDGRVSLGTPELQERCRAALDMRCGSAGAMLVTTNARAAREFGGSSAVLHQGQLYFAEDIEDAIAAHQRLVREHSPSQVRITDAASVTEYAEPEIEPF